MSWFKPSFLNTFRYCHTHLCSYLLNDVRLYQRQQFSCLSSAHKTKLLAFKDRKTERSFSFSERFVDIFREVQSVTGFTNFSKNWKGFIPVLHLRYKEWGHLWYKTLDEVDADEFITLFDMDDTFFSRFNVIELHVWMLLFNFPAGGKINDLIRKGIVEAMWKDSEDRGYLLEKFNPNFRKNFKKLSQKFQVSLLLYDHGFMDSDMSLSNALWYNFYDRKHIDPRILEGLVEYIRHQMQNLSQLDYKALSYVEDKVGIWKSPQPFVRHV